MPWGWFTQALCVRGRSDGICKASSGGASPLIPAGAPRRWASPLTSDVRLVAYKFMTGARFRTIADDVRERIALGDLGDSGALESEAVLGQRYGASRVTVRRALELLREQGLVESRQGSGWFVTGGSFHQTLALGHLPARVLGGRWSPAGSCPGGWRPSPTRHPPAAVARACSWRPGRRRCTAGRSAPSTPCRWTWSRSGCRRRSPAGSAVPTPPTPASGRPCSATATGSPRCGRASPPASPATRTRRCSASTPAPRCCSCAGWPWPRDGGPVALSDHRYLAHRFSLEVEFHGWPTADEPPGLRTVADPD